MKSRVFLGKVHNYTWAITMQIKQEGSRSAECLSQRISGDCNKATERKVETLSSRYLCSLESKIVVRSLSKSISNHLAVVHECLVQLFRRKISAYMCFLYVSLHVVFHREHESARITRMFLFLTGQIVCFWPDICMTSVLCNEMHKKCSDQKINL